MRIAYLAPEMGAVTSTFIYREMDALGRMGQEVLSFSTRRPADSVVSDEARTLIAQTEYLYDTGFFRTAGELVLAGFTFPHKIAAAKLRLFRDMLFGRFARPLDRLKLIRQFAAAVLLARRLRKGKVQHIHAHFAHVPATIAMYAARMAGIPFSFTAHANDLFVRRTLLQEKVRRCTFTACISDYNRRFLIALRCDTTKLHVVHCGIDTARYVWKAPGEQAQPARLLSIGRLVPKKGLHVLLDALALLQRKGHKIHCTVVGGGPEEKALRAQAEKLSIASCVEFTGSLPQERVTQLLAASSLFVLPCIRDAQGDQDGIPVALMEAMAMGIPVVTTSISGIPELVTDGVNGFLARPGDAGSLADAVARSLDPNEELSQRISAAARKTIEEHFDVTHSAAQLKRLIQTTANTAQQ